MLHISAQKHTKICCTRMLFFWHILVLSLFSLSSLLVFSVLGLHLHRLSPGWSELEGGPGDVIQIHHLQDGVLVGGLHLLAGHVCHGQPGGCLDCHR